MKRLMVVGIVLTLLGLPVTQALASGGINCWFPPGWQGKTDQAEAITQALSSETGIKIEPRIAGSYPEILTAFSGDEKNLVYVGSFVQAIINARGLGTGLVQSQNGKELYSGVLIYPTGQDPEAILRDYPTEIAYAIGASSGESTAKAATKGQAQVARGSHAASCQAVLDGKAKAAAVKNWWWEANHEKYPGFSSYDIPAITFLGNPDNVLTASNAVPQAVREKLIVAAMKRQDVFNADKVQLFDNNKLRFSLWLMEQGKIDPLSYTW